VVTGGENAGRPGPSGPEGGEVRRHRDGVVSDGRLDALRCDREQAALGRHAEEDDVGHRRRARLAPGHGRGVEEGATRPARPGHGGAEIVDGHGPVEDAEDHRPGQRG
jgi:hypothetical protein